MEEEKEYSFNCPNCRLPVKQYALMCPSCGISFSEYKRSKRNRVFYAIGAVAFIAFFFVTARYYYLNYVEQPEMDPAAALIPDVEAREKSKTDVRKAEPSKNRGGISSRRTVKIADGDIDKKSEPLEAEITVDLPEVKVEAPEIIPPRTVKPALPEKSSRVESEEKIYSPRQFSRLAYDRVCEYFRRNNISEDVLSDLDIEVDRDEIIATAKLNLDNLDEDNFTPDERDAFRQVKRALPMLFSDNVRVKITGRQYVKDSVLYIDPETDIKIGFIKLPLKAIIKLLAADDKFKEEITLAPFEDMQIIDVTPKGRSLIVRSKYTR